MTKTNNAAIESLRTFAVRHNEMPFAHLCTAALNGEVWAVERVNETLAVVGEHKNWTSDEARIFAVRTTDCSRPDGATARKFSF